MGQAGIYADSVIQNSAVLNASHYYYSLFLSEDTE